MRFCPGGNRLSRQSGASSKGGYKKIWSFVKFHRALPLQIRQLNYKNHILMYIKNSPCFCPQFFIREFFMLFYILFFEIGTLKILPELLRSIPSALEKRNKKTAL